MIKRRKSPRIFFGWWTLLAGSLINLWDAGYHLYGFSALLKPLAAELGFSRAVTSVPAAISRLVGAIVAPLAGGLIDKSGPRRVIITGTFLFGLGLILMYYIESQWGFYIVWGVIVGTGSSIGASMPVDKALADWFVKKRGLAQGIRWVFRGLGGVAVLPLITWLIITQSWRIACLIGGVVMLVVGWPLAWFCFKSHRPEYYGLLPDGATITEELNGDTSQMIQKGVEYAAEVQEVEFTLRQAMRTPTYWLLIVASALASLAGPAFTLHAIPFLTDIGIDPLRAAGILGTLALASIPARIVCGLLADRVSKNHLPFIMGGTHLLQAVGTTVYLLHPTLAMIYVWFILFGTGMGGGFVLTSVIRARYFGRKALGSISGFSAMFLTPVGMAAPIYVGWVYDTTGSYISAFTLLAALLVFSGVIMFLARPPKAPAQVTDVSKFV